MSVQLEQGQFAAHVLRGLGIPVTQLSVTKLMAWEQQEGGNWHNSARYNPLNTTLALPGAGNTGTQGNIKVYTSWQQGIEATVKTLQAPSYGGIISNLKSKGDLASFETAVNGSPWGTKFPGNGNGGGEGRGASSVLGGETNLPKDAEEGASKAESAVEGALGGIWGKLGEFALTTGLLLVGLVLVVYGIMVAVRPRDRAGEIPIPVPV